MSSLKTRISEIRYNPAERAFEALVTLTDRGDTFTYPMSLRAGLDMDAEVAEQGLTDLAIRRHKRGPAGLHSHRQRSDMHGFENLPAAAHALWDRLLGRAA